MMVTKKSALGRGFDALMPQDFDVSLLESNGEKVDNIAISSIIPNPDQPRRYFDETALSQLADSIKRFGVLQPLIVTPAKERGHYIIVAGERRWRASGIANLQKVPAIVRTSKELEQLEISLVENIQRVDLSPLEQAASISRLHDLFNLSFDEIAARLGKAPSTLNNIVRLLRLSPAAQQALNEQKITEGHARALLALADYPDKQEELLILIQRNGWSVRQAEQYVTAIKAGSKAKGSALKRTKSTTPETEHLSKKLNRPITVTHTAKGGRLQIGFTSPEDLEKLLELLDQLK